MILPIYIYGQPVLRKVAEDITPDYPELQQLIADMWETLAESEGIGLAAPQIGRAIRLSVIDLDVLGDDLYVGAHAMACTEGLWDEREFLDHCAKDKNAKSDAPIPIKYFACSFYDDKPNLPHGLTLAQTVGRIRERAESLGLNDLRYGIDEGRILDGSKGFDDDDLIHRIVGQTYQAAYDARTFKIMVDNDIDYFSAWSYSSSGPYSGYPLIAYRVAEQLAKFKNAKLLKTKSEKTLAEGVDCDAVADVRKDAEETIAASREVSLEDCKGGIVKEFFLSALRLVAPLL